MSNLTFRYAEPDDCDALHALIEHAYRAPDTAGRWDSESHLLKGPRTSRAFIQSRIVDDDSRFVIAEAGGALAGCALIQKSADLEGGRDTAYFGMFAIDGAARSRGVGRTMLAECEARAIALWASAAMVMTVISLREELIGWYVRRGYRLTGARHPFPFSETTGEVRNDFDLVELRKDF